MPVGRDRGARMTWKIAVDNNACPYRTKWSVIMDGKITTYGGCSKNQNDCTEATCPLRLPDTAVEKKLMSHDCGG